MDSTKKVAASSWVTEVRECDVLLGRGKRSYNHSGNLVFRDLVVKFAPDYQASQSKPQRKAMAIEIMNEVEKTGGKFLKPVDSDKANQGALAGRWEIVPKHIVRTKVKQALRDMPTNNPVSKSEARARTQPIFKQALENMEKGSEKPPARAEPSAGSSIGKLLRGTPTIEQQHQIARGSEAMANFLGVGETQVSGTAAASITTPTSMQQLAQQMAGSPSTNAMLPRHAQPMGGSAGAASARGEPSLNLPGGLFPVSMQSLQMYLESKQREEQIARALQQQKHLQQQVALPTGNLFNFAQASSPVTSTPSQLHQGIGLLGSGIGGGYGAATIGDGRFPTNLGNVSTQVLLQALLNQQQRNQNSANLNFPGQCNMTQAGLGPTSEIVDPVQLGIDTGTQVENASYGGASASSAALNPTEHIEANRLYRADEDNCDSSNESTPSSSPTKV